MSESEGEENADIAAIMGFGSFGDQRQSKKRKVDHAVTLSSTGANSTSLGIREKPAEQAHQLETQETTSPSLAEGTPTGKKSQKPSQGLASYLARGAALPEKPPPSATSTTASKDCHQPTLHTTNTDILAKTMEELSQQEIYRLRKGVKNENGEDVYFQPSFLEDPWGPNPSHVFR